jgi:hypothetical protein
VRTQLNILAAGVAETAPCFPAPLDLNSIRTLRIPSAGQVSELASILAHARAHKVEAPWVDALRARLAAWMPMDEAPRRRVHVKRWAAGMFAAVGLDGPAKRAWRRGRRTILKACENIKLKRRGALRVPAAKPFAPAPVVPAGEHPLKSA